MRHVRQIILDGLGILLILAAPFLGILPGPGGILVFAAGLWLLGHNHGWAKRWLEKTKQKSLNLVDSFFVNNPLVQALYDLVAVLLIILGVYILDTRSGTIPITFASLFNVLGLSVILGNRKRLQRLTKYLSELTSTKK